MQNIKLTSATRECNNPNVFLGYEGENNANKLVFEFTDGFVDGIGVLYVKRGEEPAGTVELKKVGETYEFPVKSSILSKIGEIIFQVSITTSEGTTIKYDKFPMVVKDALDSDIPMPEEYPSWIEMANEKLAEIDGAITETKTATAHAEEVANNILTAKVNGEFNGKDGEDGISPTAKVAQTAEGAEVTVTDATGTTTATIKHGKDGTDGADGISSEISVKTSTETEYVLTIKDKNGSFDTPNLKGKDSEGGIVNETDPVYLADKPKLALKSEIPTKTSQLNNDNSFATEAFVTNKIAEAELSGGDVDLSGYATKDELNKKADAEDIPTKVSELDNDSGYITGYTETDPTVPSHVKGITQANITNWNNKSNFSGNYNDLQNKPDIPSIEGLATSEELTQGLAAKQDTLVAGNNITIENGVISASGSGSGGLAELPIATTDTLGGIKVGEGLEISEDGILSALSGIGGETVLWEGEGTTSDILNLSDSIEHYDFIYYEIEYTGTGGERTVAAPLISVNTIKMSGYSGTHEYLTSLYNVNAYYGFAILVTSATTIKINGYNSSTNINPKLTKVCGIKLGGGIDKKLDAVGLNRVTLFEGEATQITTYDLTDSIHNYDLILITSYQAKTNANNKFRLGTTILEPSLCPPPPTNDTSLPYWVVGATAAELSYHLQGNFEEGSKLKITTIYKEWTATDRICGICKVEGIKLGGGSSDSTPVGNIISFMGTIAPNGYLICDGAEVNIADYPKLATHFETQFGTKNHFGGDGTTTFAVPDLRNEFLRGYGELSGEVGEHQDATQHAKLFVYNDSQIIMDYTGTNFDVSYKDSDTRITDHTIRKWLSVNGTNQTISNPNYENYYAYTSRPTNIAVLYCIKY